MKVGTFLFLFILAGCLLLRAHGTSMAPLSDVQAVVVMANGSPAAKAYVAGALASEPEPTVNRAFEMKRQVERILVRELAAATAVHRSPNDLRSDAVQDQAVPVKPKSELFDTVVLWAVAFTGACLIIKALLVLLNRSSNRC